MKNLHRSLLDLNDLWHQLELLLADGDPRMRKEAESANSKAVLLMRFEETITEQKTTLDHILFLARSSSTARMELNSREVSDFDQRNFDLCEKINKLTARFHLLCSPEVAEEEPAVVDEKSEALNDPVPQFIEWR